MQFRAKTAHLPVKLAVFLLFLSSCGSPSKPEPEAGIPFDPAGTWTAPLNGVVWDSAYAGPLTLVVERA